MIPFYMVSFHTLFWGRKKASIDLEAQNTTSLD